MDTALLTARINDAVESVFLTDKPKYFGFLSKEEAVFVNKYLEKRNLNYNFYGGADNCERVYLGCFPDWLSEPVYPICAITFIFRKTDCLRHRDFLGALMSLGLKRETIGDILIEQGRAVVFLSSDIAEYVLNNLNKVGNVGVTATEGFEGALPERGVRTEITSTVASLRLDCVVSALANCSRNMADNLITTGLVAVNSVICEKNTKIITNGDIVSVRRKGKFEIISTDKKTKKDRTVLVYKSY